MFTKFVALVSLVAALAQGASLSSRQSGGPTDHRVLVGVNGTLSFYPQAIAVELYDTVTFEFMAKNHSIRQSSFADPCTTIDGGFEFPFNQVVAAGSTVFPTITIQINETTPTWISCPQTNPVVHCQQGMVFAINPNTDKTFSQYKQNAINSADNGNTFVDASSAAEATGPSDSSAAAFTTSFTSFASSTAPVPSATSLYSRGVPAVGRGTNRKSPSILRKLNRLF